MRLAVLGLGKLGAVLAAVLAEAGHKVVGVDVNPDVVVVVNDGCAPVDEPGLQTLMSDLARPVVATDSVALAVKKSSMAFVVVPTPSDETGAFDNKLVVDAVSQIGEQLRELHGKDDYIVVIVSTVMPGSTQGPIREALEKAAGRPVTICYSPEFIALGTVIRDMHEPDIVLIGGEDIDASKRVGEVLATIATPTTGRWHYLSTVDAELAKLATNVFLSVKIAFANEVAMLCERYEGASAHAVLRAVGDDSRVGRKLLACGAPAGGPCLPRDVVAFQQRVNGRRVITPLAEGAENASEQLVRYLVDQLLDLAGEDGSIGVLGVTYKVGSAVRDESPGLRVLEMLDDMERGGACTASRHAHDPTVRGMLPVEAKVWPRPQPLVDHSDVVLLAMPWPEYLDLNYSRVRVLDLWGVLKPAENVHRFGEWEPS